MKQPKISESSKQILMHISEGLTNKEIAKKMELNSWTVDMRVKRLLKKFECKTRAQLIIKILTYNFSSILNKT